MTELEILVDFHKDSERQGPGSIADTLRALHFIGLEKNRSIQIADIGCGTGGQTITLAQNTEGHITAVDVFPDFLNKLKERSARLGLKDRITPLEASMDDLPFGSAEFDILWSEGAIYTMGFEAGIRKWKKFLKPGGCIAISEITWITNTRPPEIEEYWMQAYQEIDTASAKIRVLEENGFSLLGYFPLPCDSWTGTYYEPMEKRFDDFLTKHENAKAVRDFVNGEKKEIHMYNRYKDYFSYGFYVARKLR